MGFPNLNLFDYKFLLVSFLKVLIYFVNKRQQNAIASSKEECIPQIMTFFFVVD